MLSLLQAIAAISVMFLISCRAIEFNDSSRNVVYEKFGGFVPCLLDQDADHLRWCEMDMIGAVGFHVLMDPSGNAVLSATDTYKIEYAPNPSEGRAPLCLGKPLSWRNRYVIPAGYVFSIGSKVFVPCNIGGTQLYGKIVD